MMTNYISTARTSRAVWLLCSLAALLLARSQPSQSAATLGLTAGGPAGLAPLAGRQQLKSLSAPPQSVQFGSQAAAGPFKGIQDGASQLLNSIREGVLNLLPKNGQDLGVGWPSSAQQNALASATMAAIEDHKERGLALIRQLSDQLGNKVQQFIRPAQQYADLVARYQRWFARYQALEAGLSAQQRQSIQPAMELVRDEYARLDEELLREKCAGQKADTDPSEVENVDFVFELLDRLTVRLEARLETEAKMVGADSAQLERAPSEPPAGEADEQQVANAFERVKRIALKSAADLAVNEVPRLVRLVAIKASLLHFAAHPVQSEGPMLVVQESIKLLGSASVPLAVMYLRDIQTRTALMVFDAVIQPDDIVCQLKQHLPFFKSNNSNNKGSNSPSGAAIV